MSPFQRPRMLPRKNRSGWRPWIGLLAGGAALALAPPPNVPAPDQLQKQIQEALKQLQELQQSLPTVGQPWADLQQQCTGADQQSSLFSCLPVKVSITDDVTAETWAQEPSGVLPNTQPKYCTFKSLLSCTAEGKGKLLYKKGFSEFHLLASGTPETTRIQRCIKFEQGYHFVGSSAKPVFYHNELMNGALKIWNPFQLQISYPSTYTSPSDQATKNYDLSPVHVVLAADPGGPDLWGSQLPCESVTEQEVTPAGMKAFVSAHGFEKSYSWRIEPSPGLEWEVHRLRLKVEIGDPCPQAAQLTIRTQDQQERYVFSDGKPGKLEFTLEAEVTPAALAEEVKWELPDLPGAQRETIPADAKGKVLQVIYTGLPQGNQDFGRKTIKATVQQDRCQAQAEKVLSFFFPAFARNNPGGSDPNWFYYWKQTSAALGPARFGGDTGRCAIGAGSRDLGYYRNEIFDSVYHVCDLHKLGEDFPFTTKQWQGAVLKDLKVKGIDTFAVTCQHENAHLTHFTQWWKPYQTVDRFLDTNHNGILDDKEELLDKDHDLVPDALEASLGLDPHKQNTYGIGPNGDDEEFLCWLAEAGWKIGKADQEDWAKPGKQWP